MKRNRKNLKRYFQAWELRQQGKKLREIAQIMGLKSRERIRYMVNYFDFALKRRPTRIPKNIKQLIKN